MRLVLLTSDKLAVYEGRKQIAVFATNGITIAAELVEEMRIDTYDENKG